MLIDVGMKTKRLVHLATLLAAALGTAACTGRHLDRAPASPDFSDRAPRRFIPEDLAASSGKARNAPLDIVAFHLDSALLLNSGIAQVDTAAKWMLRHPEYKIVLEGHTDRIGDAPYNEDLATRRAQIVRNHLMGWGVPSDRIVLVIYGESEAISPDNPSDRRVVMFASDRPTREIVAATLEHRHAQTAVWTQNGSLFQEKRTPEAEPQHETIATRR
ncbi:MAG: peptidoglycan-associated lipoprotein [Myxococcales bacterium]|nr:peptidoglycan-associated lipoprotein [Myxococcales bacterium]